jgi:hypothetical protein
MIVAEILAGMAIGYAAGSLLESTLHEYVSDAPARFLKVWRRHPMLFRVFLNTHFSHHVVHHYQTFRKDHVTQFESATHRAKLENWLLRRGRHGRVIIGGDFANKLHAEGAVVFAMPSTVAGLALGSVAPVSTAAAAALTLALPPLFSYFIHPYLHMPFSEGQRQAPWMVAILLKTRYMKAVYRNHFMHHRHGGTSNYNLVLGADFVRRRVRKPDADAIHAMRDVGMPLD